MESSWWIKGRATLAVVLLGVVGPHWAPDAQAQTAAGNGAASGWLAVESALRLPVQTGRPSVVVVTARTSPGSLDFVKALRQATASSMISRLVSFSEMPREGYAKPVDQMGLSRFPAVVAYGKNG